MMWSETVGLRTRLTQDHKIGLGLARCGLGLAGLVLFCETQSCHACRHNDLEGHSNFSSHWSLSVVTHAPFHASVLRPASQVGSMHEAAGMGKLVNAALLTLINEECVNVCCATLLFSQLVGPACIQA